MSERRARCNFSGGCAIIRRMAVQALYALQNGFFGFERSGLFYDERSGGKTQTPGPPAGLDRPRARQRGRRGPLAPALRPRGGRLALSQVGADRPARLKTLARL